MAQVRDGDLDKLGILFQRNHRGLFNFFLRMSGSVSTSEDLVQDVFLRILRYRHTYRGDSEFSTWMYRIARNARVDYHQKEKILTGGDQDGALLPSHDLDPRAGLEQRQEAALLRQALRALPEDDREVLLLSRFENMKYKDIADLFGCSEGALKARVHRAIKKLRDAFFELSGETRHE